MNNPLSPVFQSSKAGNRSGGGVSKPAVDTVVIPVGGKGTRLYPGTFVTPKNLLLLGTKPLISYAAEEAFIAGAKEIVIVSSPRDLEAYQTFFNPSDDDLSDVSGSGKEKQFDSLLQLREMGKAIKFSVQEDPKGLGHAVLQAKEHNVSGSFGVILPDDAILDDNCSPVALGSLVETYTGGMSLARIEVPEEDTHRYGIFEFGEDVNTSLDIQKISGVVEKPKENPPSNFAVMGRYILTPEIFDVLEQGKIGAGGEIQLTDAIEELIQNDVSAYAANYDGERFDCGTAMGLLDAQMVICPREMALLQSPEIPVQPPVSKNSHYIIA